MDEFCDCVGNGAGPAPRREGMEEMEDESGLEMGSMRRERLGE